MRNVGLTQEVLEERNRLVRLLTVHKARASRPLDPHARCGCDMCRFAERRLEALKPRGFDGGGGGGRPRVA